MDNKCNYGKTESCRKGKRSNSDKPKQPQRGLGVAQLEQIRLQNEIMANYVTSCQSPYQNGCQIKYVEAIRRDNMYSGSHQNAVIRSSVHGEAVAFPNNFIGQTNMVVAPFAHNLQQDSMQWKRHYNYQASSMHYQYYHDSMETQEVDLELRLAL